MTVTVDGKLGACAPGVNCAYKRASGTPKVASSATTDLTTNPVTITVTGTDFSVTASDYAAIEYAGRTCTPASPTATELSCDINSPIAGDVAVKVRMVATGYIEAAASRNLNAAIEIVPTISSVDPVSINNKGGQTLTINGKHFFEASKASGNTVTVTVDGKQCTNVTPNTVDQLSCTTPENMTVGAAKEVVVTINGKAGTGAVEVSLVNYATTVSPAAVAMNIKQDLTITMVGVGNTKCPN